MDNNRVLIIYTGGTIGMSKKDENSESLVNKDEIINMILNKIILDDNDRVITTSRIIDSSQFDYLIFNEIMTIFQQEYSNYSGFVIISGTDTMAYLHSLLKWQINGLDKPIVLTGAIKSYEEDQEEGVNNIKFAIEQVGLYKNKGIIGIAMNNNFLDKPTYKHNSVSKSPFREITDSDLEILRNKLFDNSNELKLNYLKDSKIEITYINPFMYITENEDLLDGLLILAYGQGTFKEDIMFKNRVKKYSQNKRPIVVLSQCIKNKLDVKQYNTGRFLEGLQVHYCGGSSIEEGIAYINYLINNNMLPS